MSRIFINYRRDSAAAYARLLYDRLIARFGREIVYMDMDVRIPFGHDFRTFLEDAVNRCEVMLTVIDRHWLTASDKDGRRRLDNPTDLVRLEITLALGRGIPVVPVVMEGARIPHSDELPDTLTELAFRQRIEVSDERFNYDVGLLIQELDRILNTADDEPMVSLASQTPTPGLEFVTLVAPIQKPPLTDAAVTEPPISSKPRRRQIKWPVGISIVVIVITIWIGLYNLPILLTVRPVNSERPNDQNEEITSSDITVAKFPSANSLPNSIGMEFVLIEAGEFLMGFHYRTDFIRCFRMDI